MKHWKQASNRYILAPELKLEFFNREKKTTVIIWWISVFKIVCAVYGRESKYIYANPIHVCWSRCKCILMHTRIQMYICTYIYMCAGNCVCVVYGRESKYIYANPDANVYWCIYAYRCTYVHTYTYMCRSATEECVLTYTYVHIHMMNACLHIHMYIYKWWMCAYIYIFTYAHDECVLTYTCMCRSATEECVLILQLLRSLHLLNRYIYI